MGIINPPSEEELAHARVALGPAIHAMARAFVESGVMTDEQAFAWVDAMTREHVLELRRQRGDDLPWWRRR